MPAWNSWTEDKLRHITDNLRAERIRKFVDILELGPSDRVLDLGSEDGSYLASHYPYPENIWLADIDPGSMQVGVEKYNLGGFVPLPEDGLLPLDDNSFDAVFCNSVIEHVTVDKSALNAHSNSEFFSLGRARQKRFSMEIERVGRKYFVQTPNRNFPIEAHSWLPFTQFLPHQAHLKAARMLSKVWVKQWTHDFILYNEKRLVQDFPNATAIYREKVLGLTKSLIAYKL